MPVDPRAFREAIRTVHVSYPIPFLVAITFAFSLVLIGLSPILPGAVSAYVFGLGFGSGVLGLLLIVYSVLVKPALLRSERHEEIRRMIQIVGDKEQPIEVRQGLQSTLAAYSTASSKSTKTLTEQSRTEGDDG